MFETFKEVKDLLSEFFDVAFKSSQMVRNWYYQNYEKINKLLRQLAIDIKLPDKKDIVVDVEPAIATKTIKDELTKIRILIPYLYQFISSPENPVVKRITEDIEASLNKIEDAVK